MYSYNKMTGLSPLAEYRKRYALIKGIIAAIILISILIF